MLLFDEASSALDTETETAVMHAVSQLDPNLTLLIIAHRLQSIKDCDFIILLDSGALKELGSFDEVFADESATPNGRAGAPSQNGRASKTT